MGVETVNRFPRAEGLEPRSAERSGPALHRPDARRLRDRSEHHRGSSAPSAAVSSPRREGASVDVLLVANDVRTARVIAKILGEAGHYVVWSRLGLDVLDARYCPDVILVDITSPGDGGLALLTQICRLSSAPVLALTASKDELSVARAIRAGAADCMVKPIRGRELVAQVEATGHQSIDRRGSSKRVLELSDIRVDLDTRTVYVGENTISLTTKEFQVLAVLARQAGSAVSRQQIIDEVWRGSRLPASRSLDVHLAALRAKLRRPGLVRTIHGYGYQLG